MYPWLQIEHHQLVDEEGEGQCSKVSCIDVEIEDAEPRAFELVLAYIYRDRIYPSKCRNEKTDLSSNETTLLMMDVYRLALKVTSFLMFKMYSV